MDRPRREPSWFDDPKTAAYFYVLKGGKEVWALKELRSMGAGCEDRTEGIRNGLRECCHEV